MEWKSQRVARVTFLQRVDVSEGGREVCGSFEKEWMERKNLARASSMVMQSMDSSM
jgi:hypothetical protein